MAAYEVEINVSVPYIFVVYYVVYWSFFMVVAHKLAARNIWLALIPGVKIYLLRKMSGKEYKTGRSLFLFLVLFFAWLAALPIIVYYSSSGLLLYAVFWGGIFLYLIYRGAMLASIALRLGEPFWKALLYGVPLVSFIFITIVAFSSRQTIHEQLRTKQPQAVPPYGQLAADAQYGQGSPQRSSQWPLVCTLCGEVNPVEFSECRNCGSQLPRR